MTVSRSGIGFWFEAGSAALTVHSLQIRLQTVRNFYRVQTRVQVRDLHQTIMKSLIIFLCLVPVLLILPVFSVRVSAGPGCGPCDPAQCAPLPAEGCSAGSLLDSCGCCSVCAAAEGELCGGRRAAARRCGPGLECVKSDEDKKNKLGVCVCKTNYEVCGTDGQTYRSGCALKSASLTAQTEGNEPINIQNKGRCATGETDIIQGVLLLPGKVTTGYRSTDHAQVRHRLQVRLVRDNDHVCSMDEMNH